jgi:LuxR family maltose regulon positive regulatory protein
MKQGRLQDAIATFQDGLRMATLPDGTETFLAGFPNIRLGDVYREQNHLDLASQYLTKGIEQCRRLGQIDVLVEAYVCLGRYQLTTGDLPGARNSLQTADRLVEESPVDQWVLCWLDDLRLRVWLADGNLEAPRRWMKSSGLSPEGPLSYQHDLHHRNLARVLVAESLLDGSRGSHKKAPTLLRRLQTAAEKAGWVHEEIHILVLQAVNNWAQHRHKSGLRSLARAVYLAEPGGYVRVFVDEGEIMRELLSALEKISKPNIERGAWKQSGMKTHDERLTAIRAHIGRLLRAFADHPSRADTSEVLRQSSQLIEPLSPRELEVLNLLAQGCSDKHIAEGLVIARETVHKHLKNIYGKLGVHSRIQAVAHARELNLI